MCSKYFLHCPEVVALEALGKTVLRVLGGDHRACLLSLIHSLLLPLFFEEVATKFVPFGCPWEVMSGEI
jgi:hypothetical protein